MLESTSVREFCIVLWICERYIFDMLVEMTWTYVKRYQKIRDSGNREKTKNANIEICTGGTCADFDRNIKLCTIEIIHTPDC